MHTTIYIYICICYVYMYIYIYIYIYIYTGIALFRGPRAGADRQRAEDAGTDKNDSFETIHITINTLNSKDQNRTDTYIC